MAAIAKERDIPLKTRMFNWLSKVSTDVIQIVGIITFIGLFVLICLFS